MNKMLLKSFIVIIVVAMLGTGCELNDDGKYDPPADHDISKDGRMHKSGLNNPTEGCISCHGNELQGGSTGVSCYECHGKEW